jgi:DNA-binding response OmpR family regulator
MTQPLPNAGQTRVVIADDEPLARRRLRALLAQHRDFEIIAECASGPETVNVVTTLRPDVVLLDIEMPDLSGLALVHELPEPKPKVVFVTAHEQYAVSAFGVRALDYILKPFDEERFETTLARIRDEVREKRSSRGGSPPQLGDIVVDLGARRVSRSGRLIVLRRREFDALVRLMLHPGQVVTRNELLRDVWGYKTDVVSRTVDTHIFELRRKLGLGASEPGYIETVARIGYRMLGEPGTARSDNE